jgi:alkylation response protein AidB-like acyl-CoA dehydrogenase
MDFTLSDAEKSVGSLSERILTDLVTDASLRELELADAWMHNAAWEALAQAGLLGVALPEAHGGSDLGLIALCELLRKVGRATAPLPVLSTLVMGALPIVRYGSEAQRQKYLSGVASGRIRTARKPRPRAAHRRRAGDRCRPHAERHLRPGPGFARCSLHVGASGRSARWRARAK